MFTLPYHDQLKHYMDVTIADPAAYSYRTLFDSSMVTGATARGRSGRNMFMLILASENKQRLAPLLWKPQVG